MVSCDVKDRGHTKILFNMLFIILLRSTYNDLLGTTNTANCDVAINPDFIVI